MHSHDTRRHPTQAQGEATALRIEEKAKNKETVEDAKAAQAAVAAATAVLKDFYEKAATATGFLQVASEKVEPRAFGLKTGVKMGSSEWAALANPAYEGSTDTGHKEGMQTFGEAETGQQDEAKYGVMAMLELILSDFASLEATTTAAEGASEERARVLLDIATAVVVSSVRDHSRFSCTFFGSLHIKYARWSTEGCVLRLLMPVLACCAYRIAPLSSTFQQAGDRTCADGTKSSSMYWWTVRISDTPERYPTR